MDKSYMEVSIRIKYDSWSGRYYYIIYNYPKNNAFMSGGNYFCRDKAVEKVKQYCKIKGYIIKESNFE